MILTKKYSPSVSDEWYQTSFNSKLDYMDSDKYSVLFNLSELEPEHNVDKCVAEAWEYHLSKSGNKKIAVFLSGGFDSAVVVKKARELSIEITPVIIKHQDQLNDFDVDPALTLCDRFNYEPIVLDLSVEVLTDYAMATGMRDHAAPTWSCCQLFWACEQLGNNYYCIACEGEPRVFRFHNELYIDLKPEWDYLTKRFCQNTGLNFVYQFYQSTQKLWYNYYTHEYIRKCAADPNQMNRSLSDNGKQYILENHNELWKEKKMGFEKWAPMLMTDSIDDLFEKNHEKYRIHAHPNELWIKYNAFWDWLESNNSEISHTELQ